MHPVGLRAHELNSAEAPPTVQPLFSARDVANGSGGRAYLNQAILFGLNPLSRPRTHSRYSELGRFRPSPATRHSSRRRIASHGRRDPLARRSVLANVLTIYILQRIEHEVGLYELQSFGSSRPAGAQPSRRVLSWATRLHTVHIWEYLGISRGQRRRIALARRLGTVTTTGRLVACCKSARPRNDRVTRRSRLSPHGLRSNLAWAKILCPRKQELMRLSQSSNLALQFHDALPLASDPGGSCAAPSPWSGASRRYMRRTTRGVRPGATPNLRA